MKRKILHLIESSEAGGAESICSNIVRYLNKGRYLSVVGISGNGVWLRQILSDVDIRIVGLARYRPFDIKFLIDLISLIAKERVHLIHSHMFTMNFYGALSSLITRIPLICTIHDTYYDLSTTKRILAYQFIATIAKSVVAVSHDMYSKLVNTLSKGKNVRCILNGVVVERYQSKKKQKLREIKNIPGDQFIILNVGNLYRVKNQLFLLDVAKMLSDTINNFRFIIIGEGPVRTEIEKNIKELSLEGKVILLGLRDDVSDWLSLADVFVLPSESEGLSISLLEAMAYGLPAITSCAGGNKDVIKNGKNGILIENANAHEYSEEILRLYQIPQLREFLGKSARVTVKDYFSVRRMVNQYEELYAGCMR